MEGCAWLITTQLDALLLVWSQKQGGPGSVPFGYRLRVERLLPLLERHCKGKAPEKQGFLSLVNPPKPCKRKEPPPPKNHPPPPKEQGGLVRSGSVTVRAVPGFGSGGSSGERGFASLQHSQTEREGSRFGSSKTVPAVPVSVPVPGK